MTKLIQKYIRPPATTMVSRDAAGGGIASAPVAALAAPVDHVPKACVVNLVLPAGPTSSDGPVEIEPSAGRGNR
jgi:hypothetical protein